MMKVKQAKSQRLVMICRTHPLLNVAWRKPVVSGFFCNLLHPEHLSTLSMVSKNPDKVVNNIFFFFFFVIGSEHQKQRTDIHQHGFHCEPMAVGNRIILVVFLLCFVLTTTEMYNVLFGVYMCRFVLFSLKARCRLCLRL